MELSCLYTTRSWAGHARLSTGMLRYKLTVICLCQVGYPVDTPTEIMSLKAHSAANAAKSWAWNWGSLSMMTSVVLCRANCADSFWMTGDDVVVVCRAISKNPPWYWLWWDSPYCPRRRCHLLYFATDGMGCCGDSQEERETLTLTHGLLWRPPTHIQINIFI